MILVIGLSHRTAPIEVRERLSLNRDTLPEVLRALGSSPHIGEVMCVSTCNRVDVFATPREPQDAEAASREVIAVLVKQALGGHVEPHLYRHLGTEALRHVFRVAASLDSLVVGEPQILGQVKDAFEVAQATATSGPALGRVMSRALHAAKRVRSETAIGEGLVSVSSVAVDLAAQIFGDLKKKRALLIGAGQMAEAAAIALAKSGAEIVVVNRSEDRARELAVRLGPAAQTRPWAELPLALVDADVVISSTGSPGFVVTHELLARVQKQRRGRTLFLIDIALPRDIEPNVNTLDGVFLYNVDDLEQIVHGTMTGRAQEAMRAEAIVEEEVKAFGSWVEARGVVPTVVALRQKARSTLQAELDKSLAGRLRHLSDADRQLILSAMEAGVAKLLHAPTARLKQAAAEPRGEEMARVLRELFELPEVTVVADEPRQEKQSS
jgi:glutamyl-tRNA reductase